MKIFLVSRFDNILKQSGTHSSTRLEEQDTNSKYKQRRCKVCANKLHLNSINAVNQGAYWFYADSLVLKGSMRNVYTTYAAVNPNNVN